MLVVVGTACAIATAETTTLDKKRRTRRIDGNGVVDALTDGLLIIRFMFGLSGPNLINNAVEQDATRDTAMEIGTHLETLRP